MFDRIGRFLDQVDPRILNRGEAYFRAGHVRQWTLTDGHVTAEVSGSGPQDYCVELDLSPDGEVSLCRCSCPYDWGPVCKHTAAVLMAVQAELPGRLEEEQRAERRRLETLRNLVAKAGREQLEALVLEHCREDRLFQSRILSELEDSGQVEWEVLRGLMQESLARCEREEDPADLEEACALLEDALERARRRIGRGQPELGLALALLVLPAALRLEGEAAHSSEVLDRTAEEALEIAALAAAALQEPEERRRSLEQVLACALDAAFDSRSRWRYDLLNLGIDLADRSSEETVLQALHSLEEQPGSPENGAGSGLLRYRLYRTVRGPEEARGYLEQHPDREELRQILVLERLGERDFTGAEALCLQELERTPCGNPDRWRRLLYEIYRDWGKREAQIAQVFELAKKEEEEYGRRLRDLLSGEELCRLEEEQAAVLGVAFPPRP